MEIQKEIMQKFLEQAAIEQLSLEYQKKGFEISREAGDFRADLIVRKGDEIIVFEIKAGKWDKDKRLTVRALRNWAVHELGAKFNIVFANLPEESTIEVEGLEALLFDLLPEYLVDEFSNIASQFWSEEVSDLSFESISVQKNIIEIIGTGMISLGFQYGSDSDYRNGDGLRFSESYPFNFHIALDHNLQIAEVFEIGVDLPDDSDE